jgi:hypothetical protein
MNKHTIVVGDLFVSSWGYDQTNIDFYQVVGVNPSGKTIKIQKISSKVIEDGVMAGKATPVMNTFEGPVMTKLVKPSNHFRYSLKITSYAYAYFEADKTKAHYTSWCH